MSESIAVHPSISRDPIPTDAKDLATVCVLCSHNCGVRVDVSEGRISAVRADESNPITRGYICNKGFRIAHTVSHAQRLEHPLRRRADGSFERISWDDAISEIAAKLSAVREQSGPRAIGLVGIGGQANHMDGPFGLSWLGAVGSKRWFNALAQEKTQHFLVDGMMFDSSPSMWFHPDMEHTDLLLVLGTNPRISNRGHAANDTFKRLEKSDTTLITVDPRETETTRGSDHHVRLLPGTDAWLLLGMAAVIASGEGLADAGFIERHTVDFEQLRGALAEVDVDEMARRCGIASEQLVAVARDYASAPTAAIMFDLAVEQNLFSTLISYLIRVLSVLTGNVGSAGGNTFMETQTPPEWSPKRFEEPERTLAAGIRGISAMGGFPMFSPTLVPEEILVDHPERLRALVVEASNPILSYSDTKAWREAREKLDLLVVMDVSWTETAALADYVLPAPSGYEKYELAGFPKAYPEVYVQVRPPVVPAPGDALPEPEFYAALGEAMGLWPKTPDDLFALAEAALEPAGAMAYLGALMAASGGDQAKMLFWTYRALGPHLPSPALAAVWMLCHQNAMGRREGVLRTLGAEFEDANPFELAHELFRRSLEHPEGTEIAKGDSENNLASAVGWDDGRIRLAPEELLAEIGRAIENGPPSDPDFPFVLALGLRTRWTANTIQRDPAWRQGRGPFCALHLSRGDAMRLGVAEGDPVRITTRRGGAELPAAIDRKLRDGHVWVPNGFGAKYPDADGRLVEQGINLNELSDAADRDPITGCPHHKATPCRVERAAA